MPLDLQKNTLQPGHKLFWYTIQRVLGQGGFGITYLAIDNNLEQNVALKEFLPSEIAVRNADFTVEPKSESYKDQYESLLDRFLTEAKTLARFDHPNIVRVYSVFETNNSAYIVMRYEEGKPLNNILKQKKSIPEEKLLNIVLPILEGLSKVHKQGFIHRDIQPANIYIRDDGSPVLLDFGAARQAIGDSRTLTILVAPGYAPFEQYYSSGSEQGPWSDIYGMGATLYRAVAGVAPIDAIERSKGMLGSTRDVLVPAKVVGKGRYSDSFLAAIDHALEFNEKDRPQTVMEWAGELSGETGEFEEKSVPRYQSTSHEIQINESETATQIPQPPSIIRNWTKTIPKPSIPATTIVLLFIFLTGIIFFFPNVLKKNSFSISPNQVVKQEEQSQIEQVSQVEEKITSLQIQMDEEMSRLSTLQEDLDTLQSKREEEQQLISELQAKRINAEQELREVEMNIQQAEQERIKAEEEKRQLAEQQRIKVEEEKRRLAEQERIQAEEEKRRLAEQERIKVEEEKQKIAMKAPAATSVAPKIKELTAFEKGMGAYNQSLYSEALRLLGPEAENGNPDAQYVVGKLYLEGRGILANNTIALKWIREAAWQGHKEAQVSLARMYSSGIDGKQDPFLSYIWYLVAERNGNYAFASERNKVEELLQPEQFPQALSLAKDIDRKKTNQATINE